MDFNDECDDLADDDYVSAPRARAREMLTEISRQAKQALAEDGIDLSLFFVVPSSSNAVVVYGTPGDPDDDLWRRVGEIVLPIVERSVGLNRGRCNKVVYATTADQLDSIVEPRR